jgi:hypothetical protein
MVMVCFSAIIERKHRGLATYARRLTSGCTRRRPRCFLMLEEVAAAGEPQGVRPHSDAPTEVVMNTRFAALVTTCVLSSACGESTAPAPWSYVGEWAGQAVGSNIDLRIDAATAQSVSGRFAASANLSTGGCGSAAARDSLRQGQLYPDSLVFYIPTAAGASPSQLRCRAVRFGNGVSLAIGAGVVTSPEIALLTRC